MIRLSPERAQTMLAIHGWSAVFLGLLLYVVIVTGVTSVFAKEIGDWSNPSPGKVPLLLAAGTDRSLRAAAATINPEYHEAVTVYPKAGDRLWAFFHKGDVDDNGFPTERGVGVEFDPQSGEISARHEGTEDEVYRAHESHGLAQFLVELHISLHIPFPWGMLLTGVLGVSLLVLTVSGLFYHRALLKEIFTLRRRAPKLATRDLHVVSGTWILPFALILSLTGSYMSLFAPLGMPLAAQVEHGGDQTLLLEVLEADAIAENTASMPIADIDAMLEDARRRAGSDAQWMDVHHWGRADASVMIGLAPRERGVSEPKLVYRGATGEFVQVKPGLGAAPAVGGVVDDVFGPLHFGSFAGLLSQAVWLAMGYCLAYVALSGMMLWVQRRQEGLWGVFGRLTVWIGYGLPFALVAVAHGYFVALAAGGATYIYMLAAFLGAAVLSALAAFTLGDARRVLLVATGTALLALPLMRWLTGGPGWGALWDSGWGIAIAIDIALLVGGGFALRSARRDAGGVARAPAAVGLPGVGSRA
jgi:uncharacterized iron-regulated membrane protein